MPGAGHIIHMPAHIYLRVGRYVDVVTSNQKAVAADEDYIAQCRAQGMYPLGYYPHNIHFVWMGATMSGQSRLAIEAARKTATSITSATPEQLPFVQGFLVVPYYALVRFGKWDEILAEPKPAHDTLFTRAIWHFARGSAFAAKGQPDQAGEEQRALSAIASDPALAKMPQFSLNPPDKIVRVALEVLNGDLAARRKQFDAAIAHLDRAVRLEDALTYTEPPDWPAPVRLWLGAALLDAGRPAEAEVVYWEDLRSNRENGWALIGLRTFLDRSRTEGRSGGRGGEGEEGMGARRRHVVTMRRTSHVLLGAAVAACGRGSGHGLVSAGAALRPAAQECPHS